MGRPSLYTDEILSTICERLAKGVPLTVICREGQESNPQFPAPRTVREWETEEPETIGAAIARARAAGEEAMAEECLEIADDGRNDFVASKDGLAFNAEHVQRSKLRIETRLKLLAKFNPKRWGDKVEVDNKHSGQVGMTILTAVPEPAPEPDDGFMHESEQDARRRAGDPPYDRE